MRLSSATLLTKTSSNGKQWYVKRGDTGTPYWLPVHRLAVFSKLWVTSCVDKITVKRLGYHHNKDITSALLGYPRLHASEFNMVNTTHQQPLQALLAEYLNDDEDPCPPYSLVLTSTASWCHQWVHKAAWLCPNNQEFQAPWRGWPNQSTLPMSPVSGSAMLDGVRSSSPDILAAVPVRTSQSGWRIRCVGRGDENYHYYWFEVYSGRG